MKVILPNNGFGQLVMLAAVLLTVTVPFAITYWLVSMVAPWWVAVPCSLSASFVATMRTVTFK